MPKYRVNVDMEEVPSTVSFWVEIEANSEEEARELALEEISENACEYEPKVYPGGYDYESMRVDEVEEIEGSEEEGA